jgi:hypothetical protein
MKSFVYLLVLAAGAIGAWIYYHGTPDVSRVIALIPHPASAVAVGVPPPSGSSASALPPSGVCYLTIPIKVPNQFGMVTYPRGAMVRYLGQQGDRLVVEKGDAQFTVSREMLGPSP